MNNMTACELQHPTCFTNARNAMIFNCLQFHLSSACNPVENYDVSTPSFKFVSNNPSVGIVCMECPPLFAASVAPIASLKEAPNLLKAERDKTSKSRSQLEFALERLVASTNKQWTGKRTQRAQKTLASGIES